jgi:diguanylate cyclase (GGDEF)-like protein
MISPDAIHHECILLNSVMSTLKIGAIVLNATQEVILWNLWMEKHSGFGASQVLGKNLFDLFPELSQGRILSAVLQALQKNSFPSVVSQKLNKAPFPLYSHFPVEESMKHERMQQAVEVIPLRLADMPRHCLIQIADVSAAVGREKLLLDQTLVLRSQTLLDGLTCIANRRHFDLTIEKEMRRSKRTHLPMSLALIDIDYFKAYNDYYGHQQGDDCLIQVASELSASMRRPADFVARYGGEEFAVILPETNNLSASKIMEAIRIKIAERVIEHRSSTVAPHISVSIGLATFNGEPDMEVKDLIGHADQALYQAKGDGRNRVVCHDPNLKL